MRLASRSASDRRDGAESDEGAHALGQNRGIRALELARQPHEDLLGALGVPDVVELLRPRYLHYVVEHGREVILGQLVGGPHPEGHIRGVQLGMAHRIAVAAKIQLH